MKDNRLTIRIAAPLARAFAFPLNPQNTPLYWDSIVKEETNEWPPRVGTIYRNQNKEGKWSQFFISAFQENELFEFTSEDKNYHARWMFSAVDTNTTKVDYYEWVDTGEIDGPFTVEILEKVKTVIEQS